MASPAPPLRTRAQQRMAELGPTLRRLGWPEPLSELAAHPGPERQALVKWLLQRRARVRAGGGVASERACWGVCGRQLRC